MMRGECLCGAVRIEIEDFTPEISVCHCETCRRWSGGAFNGFNVPKTAARITGEMQSYRSSAFAQRLFCATCGTHLGFDDDDSPDFEFCAGLFESLRDVPLNREVYADQAFASMKFEGGHKRITRAEYERDNPHVKTEV
ncbi:GFA family protein [Sulfitobacter sp. LCG007]